jgi:UDP-N-acetylglucosamine--N-acetylmuramyl-(pentapeptide) pyrophosphoryl-undecaprenol N-acetylglucosamine transferase
MGGSSGARRINQVVWQTLARLRERFEEVVHLTGPQGRQEAALLAQPGYRPISSTTDLPSLMNEADLVLCRSGVGTCAEATAVGLPMILVPGTFGGGHQEQNASKLVLAGAALRIGDAELTSARLLSQLDQLDGGTLRSMAAASAAIGRSDAAQHIVRVLEKVAVRRHSTFHDQDKADSSPPLAFASTDMGESSGS